MGTSSKIYNEELLSDADVLNTKIGTQLIDNFSKVDPDRACDFMEKAFGRMPLDELSKIKENRPSLCWTLSRLCFNKNTFERAAELMLRFVLSEKDDSSNTGHEGLNKLFYPRLGATEADLKMRQTFIEEHIERKDCQGVMMRVMECCLTFQAVFFYDGTEKLATRTMNYYQPEEKEVAEYVESIIVILNRLITGQDEKNRNKAVEILENHFIELCSWGFARIVIPVLEIICEKKQFRWDSMLDKLLLFHDKMKTVISSDLFTRYEIVIDKLTKDDFEFRFKRVEKELYSGPFRSSTEKLIGEQRRRYEALGLEFCHKRLFSKEILASLYDTEVISTTPFGEELAKGVSIEQIGLFVDYSVEILNKREKSQNDILIDFTVGLSEEEFGKQFEKLKRLNTKWIIYAAVARRSTSFISPYMNILVEMVKKGEAPAQSFVTFWSNYRFAYMKDREISDWMVRVRELPDGTQAVLHILQSAITGDAYTRMPRTVEVAVDTVMSMKVEYHFIMHFYQYWNVVRLLLTKGNYPELAHHINEIIIGYVKMQDGLFLNNFEISQTYRILLSKYFETVWEDISNVLLSDGDDLWDYYRLKDILGSMIGGVHNEVGLLFENNHIDALLEWCRKNPAKAPERLMDMTPVFDDKGNLHMIVAKLIDDFGENPAVLRALEHNLGCFGVCGSVIPLYDKQIKAIEPLRIHPHQAVREWSEKMILYLKGEKDKEKK